MTRRGAQRFSLVVDEDVEILRLGEERLPAPVFATAVFVTDDDDDVAVVVVVVV